MRQIKLLIITTFLILLFNTNIYTQISAYHSIVLPYDNPVVGNLNNLQAMQWYENEIK